MQAHASFQADDGSMLDEFEPGALIPYDGPQEEHAQFAATMMSSSYTLEEQATDGCCRVLHALVEASHVVVEPIRIAAQRSAEVVCERNREMCSGSNQQAYQAPALSTVSTHRHEPKNASWQKYGDSVCHLLRWGHAKAIVWIRHISYQLLSYYYMKYKYCAAALTLAAVWWPTRELRGGSAEASSTEPRSRRKPSAPPFERTHRHLEAPSTSSAIACAWSASGMDELTN